MMSIVIILENRVGSGNGCGLKGVVDPLAVVRFLARSATVLAIYGLNVLFELFSNFFVSCEE